MILCLIGAFQWFTGKEATCQCKRHWRHKFDPWVRKLPWRRKWQPTPVFVPGESHEQRSLAGYVHGVIKSQTQLSTHTLTWHVSYNIRDLQYVQFSSFFVCANLLYTLLLHYCILQINCKIAFCIIPYYYAKQLSIFYWYLNNDKILKIYSCSYCFHYSSFICAGQYSCHFSSVLVFLYHFM